VARTALRGFLARRRRGGGGGGGGGGRSRNACNFQVSYHLELAQGFRPERSTTGREKERERERDREASAILYRNSFEVKLKYHIA